MELTDKIKEVRKKSLKKLVTGIIITTIAGGVFTYLHNQERKIIEMAPHVFRRIVDINKSINDIESLSFNIGNSYRGVSVYEAAKINCDSVSARLSRIRSLEKERDSLKNEENYKEYNRKYGLFYGPITMGGIFVLVPMFLSGAGMIYHSIKKLRETKK